MSSGWCFRHASYECGPDCLSQERKLHKPSCVCVLCEQASASRVQQRNFDMLLGFELKQKPRCVNWLRERAFFAKHARCVGGPAFLALLKAFEEEYPADQCDCESCQPTLKESLMTETLKTPHDSATALVVSELRTLKTSLEMIAGRATPVSAVLGKAVSELCFQDADRAHKCDALAKVMMLSQDGVTGSGGFGNRRERMEHTAQAELAASQRVK